MIVGKMCLQRPNWWFWADSMREKFQPRRLSLDQYYNRDLSSTAQWVHNHRRHILPRIQCIYRQAAQGPSVLWLRQGLTVKFRRWSRRCDIVRWLNFAQDPLYIWPSHGTSFLVDCNITHRYALFSILSLDTVLVSTRSFSQLFKSWINLIMVTYFILVAFGSYNRIRLYVAAHATCTLLDLSVLCLALLVVTSIHYPLHILNFHGLKFQLFSPPVKHSYTIIRVSGKKKITWG